MKLSEREAALADYLFSPEYRETLRATLVRNYEEAEKQVPTSLRLRLRHARAINLFEMAFPEEK